MKLISAFLLLWLTAFSVKAQQSVATKLFDMAATADRVVYGVISKVDDLYFYTHIINEKGKQEQLKVLKYVSKANAYRWDKYQVGQKVFLFLKKINGSYSLMSNGEEAELAVLKDTVVVDMKCFTIKTNQSLAGPGGITPAYRDKQSFMVGNKKVFGLRFHVRYFYNSVMDFRNCYQVLLKRPGTSASTACFNFFERYTRDKINAYKKKSLLLKLMYNDMEDAQSKNCKSLHPG